MTLFASQPHMTFAVTSAKAAVADTYHQLNLFGDVFERVRADYRRRELPRPAALMRARTIPATR
jgi:hypothetical protein